MYHNVGKYQVVLFGTARISVLDTSKIGGEEVTLVRGRGYEPFGSTDGVRRDYSARRHDSHDFCRSIPVPYGREQGFV